MLFKKLNKFAEISLKSVEAATHDLPQGTTNVLVTTKEEFNKEPERFLKGNDVTPAFIEDVNYLGFGWIYPKQSDSKDSRTLVVTVDYKGNEKSDIKAVRGLGSKISGELLKRKALEANIFVESTLLK